MRLSNIPGYIDISMYFYRTNYSSISDKGNEAVFLPNLVRIVVKHMFLQNCSSV